MATHSSILAWRIPKGQKSLAGYCPWGPKESDTPTGLPSKRGPGLGSFSRADRGIGGVRPVAPAEPQVRERRELSPTCHS